MHSHDTAKQYLIQYKNDILIRMRQKGFTLIELLVVVAIIGFISSIGVSSLSKGRDKAHYARALAEFKTMSQALELYFIDNGTYPPDVARNIPPGIGGYLAGENIASWPKAPWPGSLFDWENWDDPDNPGKRIYQISIRFCPQGGPLSSCKFPDEPWATGFDVKSALYYCIEGSCRSHGSEPISYPGHCVNCP